jgi:2-phospho-L-lactate/phosphoenolpyruvate guanylyltransferase
MRTNVRGVWAIVPVKTFARAKQRLALVLSAEERARLAEVMLCDVLEQLRALSQLEGILVVTADPLAAQIAGSFGARHIRDPLESGVNPAVARGLGAVPFVECPVAIIAADVPFATSTEIADALSRLEQHSVVLTPAETDGGTNLLALRRAGLIEPSFGEGSFARHREQARTLNLSCSIFRANGLGHDIDRAGDLLPPASSGGKRVTALLEHLNVTARLETALEQPQLA